VEWPEAQRFIAELSPNGRAELLRVLTSSAEERDGVIKRLHERGSEVAELLVLLEEREWARRAMIEELRSLEI
jgi:hypothetical protein